MKLHVSDDLKLPVDAATQTFAFIGRKRSGKTYAAGKLIEELLSAGVQVVILDTVGNWYGLRLDAAGKKPSGFDVPIFGGLRGDIALNAHAGELIADVLADTSRSAIIDLSQFTGADRKRFATAFGERLWQRKKAESHPSPVHLVIEECQLIIPQFVGKDEARMVGIFEQIVRLGGNYGVGVSMITQRPQSVNKEALTQTECLFCFQVNGVPERKAIREWVTHQGLDVKLVDELPGLPVGTAWVWSPQWLGILKKVEIAKKKTLDASSTPRVGEHRERRNPAPLDLEGLGERMASLVEEAKANDPRELKRRIADLEKQLREKPAATKPEKIVQEVRVPVLSAEQTEAIQSVMKEMRELRGGVINLEDALSRLGPNICAALNNASKTPRSATPNAPVRPAERVKEYDRPRMAESTNGDGGHLPRGEQAVLSACIQYPNGLARKQLTVLTGYKRSSRDAYVQRLREKGYLDTSGDLVRATVEGMAALPHAEPLPTGPALQEHWLARLPAGESVILQHLIAAYPHEVDREKLSDTTGYKRSSRDAYLQRLRAKELVEEPSRGTVRASETLFMG